MNSLNKLYLIDAYALIFRSYYAFIKSPMFNTEGLNTSTIFGFLNTIEDILSKENPTHFAVAFDPPGGSFRNLTYPLYKANRDATPEEIIKSVPIIKEVLQAYNIPIIQVEGFEADDVIGTMAKSAAKEGFQVYMVTPDKDYIQLLDKNIFIHKPGKAGSNAEIISTENIRNYFEVDSPGQFLEMLALMGDKADNVPGAPGIGEKTAAKLLLEFNTVENLFNNLDKLKGKVQENISNNIDSINLSKELCTIVTNVPISLNPSELVIKKPDWNLLKPLFQRLNFINLEKRVSSRLNKVVIKQATLFDNMPISTVVEEKRFRSISDVNHSYIVINSLKDLTDLIIKITKLDEVCFDTETTSLNTFDCELVGISFSWKANEAYYIPFPKELDLRDKYIDELYKVICNEQIIKIGQNLKFDLLVLKNYGLELKGKIFDTMLAHYLLEPDQMHNMNFLSEKYLKYSPVPIEDLIGKKGKPQINMGNVDLARIAEYAAEDADITYQLKEVLDVELKKNELSSIAGILEMPLIPVLCDMEYTGINLDRSALKILGDELKTDLIHLEAKIFELAGVEFNIQSPKQLGEILFDRLKIDDTAKLTKTKQYSTSEDVLVYLVDKHPIINYILDYRTLRKLLNTYVEALPVMVNSKTGRLHTSFNQALTATGRLSSIDPNLQNIPIRSLRGREIRKAFIPANNEYVISSADYSQIELRIMAHMSEDENMIEAFNNNADIHTATAAKIYNLNLNEVTKDMRNKAKTANFGIIYGISAFGLSQRLKIPRKEASELIDGYFANFPKVKTYMERSIQDARDNGFVKTLYGRRRYLPDIYSANSNIRSMAERNAINSPIQGTAADIIKHAMVNIYRKMNEEKLKSKLILQVHDELVFDVYKEELLFLKSLVKDEMENVIKLKVPLLVEIGDGNNWFEAH